MKNIWNYTLLLIVSLLFAQACKQAYEGQQIDPNEKPKAQLVKIEQVEQTTTPIPIAASGMIGSKAEMNLSFKIGGIINNIYVSEGQRIRKGQLLASLKTTEIDAQVLKAQQGVDKSQRDLNRIQKLYADTAATLEQVQDLTTVAELAAADLEIAQFNQTYAKIIAPTSGRLLKKFAEENELTGAGTPIFRLASSGKDAFVIKIGVADRDVIRLRLNDRAEVHLDAIPDQSFTAFVSEIAEAADPRTGVFEVELTLNANGNAPLKNGFIGKVNVFPSNQVPYYKINMNALVEGKADRANIYVPADGKARKVSIRPEYIGKDFFTVSTNQVTDLERVITDGAAYLKEGAAIRVFEMEATKVETEAITLKE
ncbi:MAG: efflux RND transporter periplasmic adaptor subunit [Bacteroidota bacterium]